MTERSSEERERARLEREARRAMRDGSPSEPPPAPPAQAARRSEPPPPEPPRPPAPRPAESAPPPPQPPAPHPDRERSLGRAAAARSAAARRLLERRRAVGAGGPPAPPPAPTAPAGERPQRRRGLALAAVGGVIAIVVAYLALSLFQPFKGQGEGAVQVQIPRGAGLGQIADLLEARGVIADGFFFELRATLLGRREDLKAGSFRLRRDMSYVAALDALAKAPAPNVVRVVVPEGRSRREVKPIADGLEGDYLVATRRSSLLNPRSYGAPSGSGLEGFLFPATYELRRGRPVEALVEQQLTAFRREFGEVDLSYARRRNLTPYEVLIIASMVEREAQIPRERALIASVIYNRLRQGIPLGIDATVRFATNNWTRPLTRSQLAVDSPYNTRARQGLPPGPIGNPGLAAIEAAARPRRTGFLFYVVKPGTCGEHEFSETDAEFQRDVARYNRERERRGGRSPTNC